MSLTYSKGFFPYPLTVLDDGALTSINPLVVRVASPGLSFLVRLFWLAKSYDWSIAVAYTLTCVQPTVTTQSTGNLTGSGTILVENNWSVSRNTGAIPPERLPIFLPVFDSRQLPIGVKGVSGPPNAIASIKDVGNSTSTPTVGAPTSLAYTVNHIITMQWFAPLQSSSKVGLVSKLGTNYYTYLAFNGIAYGSGLGPTEGLTLLSSLGPPSGISLVIKVMGYPDITIPLYINPGFSTTTTSRSVTGTIIFNFNKFWTP